MVISPYRNIIDRLWLFDISGIDFPLFMLTIVAAAALTVILIIITRTGQRFRAVGADRHSAELAGINTDKTRIQAMIISTVLACLGQIIFLQNIGMVNVYTAHMNSDIFSCAALLAGGATIKEAKIRHALLGIVLLSLSIHCNTAGRAEYIFKRGTWGILSKFYCIRFNSNSAYNHIRHERFKKGSPG
jgi:simple sugar transport system permease protein